MSAMSCGSPMRPRGYLRFPQHTTPLSVNVHCGLFFVTENTVYNTSEVQGHAACLWSSILVSSILVSSILVSSILVSRILVSSILVMLVSSILVIAYLLAAHL